MSTVTFRRTFDDEKLIQKIVGRIARNDERFHTAEQKLALQMDITACHCNGNRLRLEELLKAEDHHFTHDVYGIYNNIDRTTGTLKNHFTPRYSSKIEREQNT